MEAMTPLMLIATVMVFGGTCFCARCAKVAHMMHAGARLVCIEADY